MPKIAKLSKEDAAQELLRRRLAKKSFKPFLEYCCHNFVDGKHLDKIAKELDLIFNGDNKRLIISLPPRHSKTETIINFILYYMSKKENAKVVLASYSESLANEQSRRCKQLMLSPSYGALYKKLVVRSGDKTLKTSDKEWQLTNGSEIYSVGVGGSLTGRGFDLGIIDDYVSGRQEANSEITKKRIDDWYKSVFFTRQAPDAAIIIVATRWAKDDLIGSILKNEKENWKVLSLPAIDEDNEALWPERFSKEILLDIKSSIGTYEWSALYQQEPTVKEGSLFKCNNITYHNTLDDFPKSVYVRAWDLASSTRERLKKNPDYSVGTLGTVIEVDGKKQLWIKDCTIFQEEATKRNQIILDLAEKDKVNVVMESFAAYKDAYTQIELLLKGKTMVIPSRLSGDKIVKASPMEVLFDYKGGIHLLKAPWNEQLIRQFQEFPYSEKDDIVDSVALVYHESVNPSWQEEKKEFYIY